MAWATPPAATVTTITASASTVAQGASATLTVTVTSGGAPVTVGQVAVCSYGPFDCSPAESFAVLQLSSSGTATIPVYGVGSEYEYYQANYIGTASYAASTSNNGASVSFTNTNVPTTTAITTIAGSPGAYTLTAALTTNSYATGSPQSPTVAPSFYDTSNANHLLGSSTYTAGSNGFTFVNGTSIAAGTSPSYVASGDFNNDGHSDLAIANTTAGTVSILLGNGDGTFQPKVDYTVGTSPGPIVIGDFDADGHLDIAVVNNGSKTISVLYGTGSGTFGSMQTYATGNNPIALAVGDLNLDGLPDLVVLNHDDKSVGVWLNGGGRTFTSKGPYPTGNDPRSISIGNSSLSGVPADGIPDVAVANFADNTITILDGNGDGTLQSATVATTVNTGNGPIAVVLEDVSDSGYCGLAYLDYTDNTMVIVAASYTGAYSTTSYSTGGIGPVALLFGFFTTESAPVPAVLNSDGTVSVYISDGNYDGIDGPTPLTYTTSQAGAVSFATGDFNSDGQPDLVVAGTSSVTPVTLLQEAVYQESYTLSNIAVPGTSMSNVVAIYPGETNFQASTSAPVSLTDTPIVTATTLSISPTSTYDPPNQVVTMTASMTPTSLGTYVPTGSFEFFDGTTVVCASVPMVSFTASCSTSALPISHNVFTAEYLGDTYFATSTSQAKVVNVANTTSVTLSLSATSVVQGTGVIATATVTQTSDGSAVDGGVVNFCSTTACTGTALLGTATLQTANGASPGTAKTSLHLANGTQTIYAEFVGTSQYAPGTSSSKSLTVTAPTKTESITSLASSGSAGNYTLTATVLGADPSAAPTGTVSFTDTKNTLFTVQSKSLTTSTTTGYTFDTPVSVPYGGDATVNGMVVADVNGDGINDLVYTNIGDETLEIKLGTGGGSFGPATEYALSTNPYCTPEGVTVADINGDGYPDIIIADDGYDFETSQAIGFVYVFFGKSNGTFSAMPDEVINIGDQNASNPNTYPGPNSTVVADFNGDGIPDMAVGTDEGAVYTLIGNGDGTFQSPGWHPPISTFYNDQVSGLTAIDINGDGFLDVAYTQFIGTPTVLLGNGDGTFQPAIYNLNNSCNGFNWAGAFVDFNGDGKPDFAASGGGQNICVQLGNGDGTFGAVNSNYLVPNNDETEGMAVADFTGDGKLDIAVAYSSGIGIFAGNGDGTFGSVKTFSGGSDDVPMVSGDLNDDGLPDLVVGAYDSSALELFTNRLTTSSSGKFTGVSIPGSATTSQHNLVATYAGDSSHTGSSSSGLKIAGTPIPTTTTLSINPSSSQPYGVAEALTATVTPSIATSFSMAGTVTFKDSGTSLTPAGAFGTSTTSTYAPTSGNYLPLYGSHSFTAVYNVDSAKNFVTSTANALAFTVTQGTPIITWTAPSTIYTGNTLTSVLTATVPVAGTFAYTATISGGSPVTVNAATVLAAGSYTVTVTFTPSNTTDYSTPAPASKSLTVAPEHLWILNNDASISEFDDGGTPLSGSAIIPGGTNTVLAGGIAFDSVGYVWSVNSTANQLLRATSTGSSPIPLVGGGLSTPVALAIDGNGAVWIANSIGSVSEFTNAGAATSPATTGYLDTSLSTPTGIAIDISGNVWVSNSGNNSVTKILGAAAPPITPLSVAVHNATLGTRP